MTTTTSTKRGDSFRRLFYFIEDGSEANLSGCAARMQFRMGGLGDAVLDVSSETGELTVGGSDGLVTVDVPAATMENVPAGRYDADVQLTYADGSVKSTTTFYVKVVQDVTR